jgi:hypothetical protein
MKTIINRLEWMRRMPRDLAGFVFVTDSGVVSEGLTLLHTFSCASEACVALEDLGCTKYDFNRETMTTRYRA